MEEQLYINDSQTAHPTMEERRAIISNNNPTAALSYQTVQDYQHVYSIPILSNCAGLSTCQQQPYLIKLCRIINMSTAALSYQTVQDYQHV